jgi:integrase
MPANAGVARTVFTALRGNLTPSALSKQVASEFRDALFELPRLYDKDRRWRDLPLAEVAAAVADYRKRDQKFIVALISKTTVSKHLTNLSTYWSWRHANGRIPEAFKNPFLKLGSKRARGNAAREARPQWPEELEKALFTSPVWTGCQSLHRRTKAGASIFRDALFWVPLLCRTFGDRSDEICSRKVGDIKFAADEIAYLEIRDSKTAGSSRDLPFCDFILSLGFLEHRYFGREKGDDLFPELLAQGVGDRHSEAFSNRFTYYRQKIGAYEYLTDTHSFRHNVTTQLANAPGVSAGWIDEITGHASEARTSESTRYTKHIYLKNLKFALDQVTIPADLSHLRFAGPPGAAISGAQAEIQRFADLAQQEMRKKSEKKRFRAKGVEK